MKKKIIPAVIIAALFSSCSNKEMVKELQLIPMPNSIEMGTNYYNLNSNASIYIDNIELKPLLELLQLRENTNFTEATQKSSAAVIIEIDSNIKSSEGYHLSISESGVEIKAKSAHGAFYGVQTLIQMLEDNRLKEDIKWTLPYVTIDDAPKYSYRGLHFDVSRHFFSVDFVKKCIDLSAQYKLNTFHWHITDAGGWRIEIKKYPRLTSFAAWRGEKDYMKWWAEGDRTYVEEGTPGAYGGYYTQEEVADIVKYAASKYITVIPEIELPGHSDEVLAAYPELSCVGKPYKSGEFCVGNEASFEFIEGVMEEVVALFPSTYIHIGGDEASKESWKKCAKCQKRMRQNGLKSEDELQSYMISRASDILAKHDRKLLGWDEILEGGLAEDATVMSWRGESGGITAAKAGHYVVMTPGSHLYLDSYQADPATQPLTIGGFTPYLKTYDYNPTPAQLTDEEAKYILGAQANVWTEYMQDEDRVEYMLFPRLLSLAEVAWTNPENKDVESFKFRVSQHIPILQGKGINTFTLSDNIDITPTVDYEKKEIRVVLSSEKYQPTIRFTTDGSTPTKESPIYIGEFIVKDSTKVQAAIFRGDTVSNIISKSQLDYHKAIGKKVTYKNIYNSGYAAQKEANFTDGYKGGLSYHDGKWQGFLRDIDVTIDMGEVMPLSYVSGRFMQLTGPGVYMPNFVKVSISDDNKEFREVLHIVNDIPTDSKELYFKEFTGRFNESARYIRFYAEKHNGFLFLDEIVVY